jgi:hypothetical protein
MSIHFNFREEEIQKKISWGLRLLYVLMAIIVDGEELVISGWRLSGYHISNQLTLKHRKYY